MFPFKDFDLREKCLCNDDFGLYAYYVSAIMMELERVKISLVVQCARIISGQYAYIELAGH